MQNACTITVLSKDNTVTLQVDKGTNLRVALLQNGISPYTSITQNLNCGGKGLCATCGVWLVENEPKPKHWHDRAAKVFGYPRLSCQISVEQDMTISLVNKWIWGNRKKPKYSETTKS